MGYLKIKSEGKMNNEILSENYKFWLGGFIEGEGSLIISVVKSNKAPHGILLQPEFNVTQHKNGLKTLNSFKSLFYNKGHVFKKSGSENVWVYSLKGTKNIIHDLIPFYLIYVVNFSSKYNDEEFNKFVFILNVLNEKSKLNKEKFINWVKLVYALNPAGKGKIRKRTLSEVISIIESKT
jgi:LAGLIDADG endonuclease